MIFLKLIIICVLMILVLVPIMLVLGLILSVQKITECIKEIKKIRRKK